MHADARLPELTPLERNRAFYDGFWETAPDYPRYNPGARHRRRLMLRSLARTRYSSVLDVGCGDGLLLEYLRRERPDIGSFSGADLSEKQVDRNRRRLAGIEFYVLDIQQGAIARTFDLVICSEVIEHVEDQQAVLRNLSSMVTAGGWLLLTCPTGRMYQTEKHFGHVRHPTLEELVDNASSAGLNVATVSNWGWPAYRFMKWATNLNPDWALRSFAQGRYSITAKAISNGLYWFNYLNRFDDARGCQLIGLFRKGFP